MKIKYILIIIGIIVLIGIVLLLLRGLNGGEDNFIKDSKGVYIKHGNPSIIPDNVKFQQDAISCANDLYNQAKINGMQFYSQCLGKCNDYSVDISHFPRIPDDNLKTNQCSDYMSGITNKFIELDVSGNIIKVLD